MTQFVVVDVSNLFFRCRYSTQGDAFTKAGMALHIMFRSIRKVWRDFQADHLVFCLDGGSWRHECYPEYKAHRRLLKLSSTTPREAEEDEVFAAALKDFVAYISEKTRCTVLYSPRVEGDDFAARWVQRHPDDRHVLVSGDSDFVQLLAPNVTLYDGMKDHVITTKGVFDHTGKALEFAIKSDGKLRVGEADPSFVAEEGWWQRALFTKIVRGDSGDNIFAAYPRVRAPRLREAYDDRAAQGYAWNNFMMQTWAKNGRTTRVLDAFRENEKLIDLTQQPEPIKAMMDAAIAEATSKKPVGNVGINFLRYCEQNSLVQLSREATEHATYLNKGFPA